jgi:hypothetical protein
VVGVDDLGVVDPLQLDRSDAEVAVPELALDDEQRDALVRHFYGVRVAELVRREATPDARGCRRSPQLGPRYGRRPRPAASRAIDDAEQRADREHLSRVESDAASCR